MTKRKSINIFGTSFLDLLSGALAAVIILFVVVPKGNLEDPELIKQVKEIKSITTDVRGALENLKNSISKDVYEKIKEEMESMQAKMKDLTQKVSQLEEDIRRISSENANLKATVQQQKEEIEQLKRQLQQLTTQMEAVKKQNKSTANTVEKTLGVFAKFGIICRWSETSTDVDIGVQCFGTNQGPLEQCWRNFPSKKWGILGEDVRERVGDDEEERFELFYVPQIYSDVYTLWADIYKGSIGGSASVTFTFVFHPGKDDEARHEIGPLSVSKGPPVLIASYRLTKNGFEIVPTRTPIWGRGEVVK